MTNGKWSCDERRHISFKKKIGESVCNCEQTWECVAPRHAVRYQMFFFFIYCYRVALFEFGLISTTTNHTGPRKRLMRLQTNFVWNVLAQSAVGNWRPPAKKKKKISFYFIFKLTSEWWCDFKRLSKTTTTDSNDFVWIKFFIFIFDDSEISENYYSTTIIIIFFYFCIYFRFWLLFCFSVNFFFYCSLRTMQLLIIQ